MSTAVTAPVVEEVYRVLWIAYAETAGEIPPVPHGMSDSTTSAEATSSSSTIPLTISFSVPSPPTTTISRTPSPTMRRAILSRRRPRPSHADEAGSLFLAVVGEHGQACAFAPPPEAGLMIACHSWSLRSSLVLTSNVRRHDVMFHRSAQCSYTIGFQRLALEKPGASALHCSDSR